MAAAWRHAPVVALGGAVGSVIRFAIDWSVEPIASVPWEILAINVVGSAALGWLASVTAHRGPAWLYPGVGTGVLGGFTTFSAVAALPAAAGLGVAHALGLLAATTVAALAGAWAGWALADATVPVRPPAEHARADAPRVEQ